MSDTWLVVGLGNPGSTYAPTRHNIGAMVVDELGKRASLTFKRHKRAIADVGEGRIAGQSVVLAKPLSYMNDSGGPVKALMAFYKIDTDHLIVLHDELDIDMGTLRAKNGGGDNGHNGLRSIRSALGTGEWLRVRLGIGRPVGQQDPADFVLRPFSQAAERDLLIQLGADAVETLMRDGLTATQNAHNS